MLISNVLNACIVGAVLWPSARKLPLVAWVATVSLVVLTRFWLTQRYQRTAPPPSRAHWWGTVFAIGSAATGSLWGLAGFFLLTHSTGGSQLVVSFVIGGMCAAAAGTIASHIPAFLAFTLLALAGLALRMFRFGDSMHLAMGGMIVLYQLALLAVARVNNRILTEAFTLRFENERLISELTIAQAGLEETNRSLERRVLERTEALRTQSETLRNAQRMEAVGRLAGGVAHDFNNLLTVIFANLSELLDRRVSKQESVIALKEIRQSAAKGADLVRQLLMFSRRQRTIPQILDVAEVLRNMEQLLYRVIGTQHTLQLDLGSASLPVRIDPAQLKQVIINLVTNARDAMEHEGVVTIAASIAEIADSSDALEPGTYVMLAVTDTGVGMDAETQQLIFDPFFTTKDVDKGTGLGLATVYGVVQQCGGEVRVSSEVSRGSCFRVYLPQAGIGLRGTAHEAAAIHMSEPAAQNECTATILLVEDEPIVRKVAKRILSREGFKVLVADSAEHALRLSAEFSEHVDILVTDVVMPGMGGGQLAEQLRLTRPMIRTLFMSGYSRDQTIPEDNLVRGTMFLAKPFTNESLVTKLRELLAAPLGVHTSAA